MEIKQNTAVLAHKIDLTISEDNYSYMMNLIKKEKQEKIKRFRFREDALRSLCGELLLRYILINYYNKDYIGEKIVENKFGKPEMENGYTNYNISHSGDWVTIVCHSSPAGIDIEKIESPPYEIMDKNFTHREIKQVEQCEPAEKSLQFYKIWTLKESYIKMMGKGLSIPLDSFSVEAGNNNMTAIFDGASKIPGIFTQLFFPDKNHAAAVCMENFSGEIYPVIIEKEELLH